MRSAFFLVTSTTNKESTIANVSRPHTGSDILEERAFAKTIQNQAYTTARVIYLFVIHVL